MKRGLALVLVLASCTEVRKPPPATQAVLPPGVAARAGGEDIRSETVQRVASGQGVALVEARDRAVTDALFAALARSTPERRDDVSSAERAALARALLESLRDRARAAGPVSDTELATLTAERWVELDRPSSVRIAHAVVHIDKPEDDARTRAFAERLASALAGAKDGEELVARAKAFPAEGFTVTAERLPPCTADGRVWEPDAPSPAPSREHFDETFARAANALEKPGDQSAPVKTPFGYHVMMLEARYPEQRLAADERRRLVWDTAIARRAGPELEALRARLRSETQVDLERSADELTALVPVVAP